MELNQSPIDHGTTPEQDAIANKVREILAPETTTTEARTLRPFIVSLVGFKQPDQWTNDEWDMLATQLDMPISFYRS